MFSSSLSRRAVAVSLACVLALSAFGGVGAAAQSDAGNQSESYEIAIDSGTRVVSSEWDGDTVTIVLESDVTRQVTITDASQRLEGAVDIRRQRVTVPSGERVEVEFTVRNEDRPAVTAGTSYGLVGLGDQSGGGYDPGPVPFGGVLVLIGIASVGTGGLTFWTVRNRRETDEKTVERVA